MQYFTRVMFKFINICNTVKCLEAIKHIICRILQEAKFKIVFFFRNGSLEKGSFDWFGMFALLLAFLLVTFICNVQKGFTLKKSNLQNKQP